MRLDRAVLLPLLLLANIASASDPSLLDKPSSILKEIKSHGSETVARELYGSKAWEVVLERIRSADGSWLTVARELRQGSDAGSSYELQLAISDALIADPSAVFSEFREGALSHAICEGSVEFADLSEAQTNLDAKISSVSKISSPEFERLKDACVEQLRASEADLIRFYDASPVGPPHN